MKHTRHYTLLLALLLSTSLQAGPREDGLQAFKQGEYQRALQFWVPLARAGDREIQYNLGVMFSEGRGVEPTMKKPCTGCAKRPNRMMPMRSFAWASCFCRASR